MLVLNIIVVFADTSCAKLQAGKLPFHNYWAGTVIYKQNVIFKF